MVNQCKSRFGKEIEELNESDIAILIDNKVDESHNLEYTEPSQNVDKDCNELAKMISGFLNTGGGIIVYGVSEGRKNDHRYPTNLKWIDLSKERLENILVSRVQPWNEKVRIKRVENRANNQEGIFVIEAPKGDNPPHMANYIYFQRLNFQTTPMPHENVFKTFQTSWLSKRELYQNIIQPLYSEIYLNCEELTKYKALEPFEEEYSQIINTDRYLYDQIDPSLQQNIDDFYSRTKELHKMLGWVGRRIAIKIINEELWKALLKLKQLRKKVSTQSDYDQLKVRIKAKDPSGSKQNIEISISEALLQRNTITEFVKCKLHELEYELVEITPFVQAASDKTDLADFIFNEVWERSAKRATKHPRYLNFWDELPKTLKLGKQILEKMLSGSS